MQLRLAKYIPESDDSNNNVVNGVDPSLLAGCFGKSPGEPGYDARVAFHHDSTINILVLSLPGINFSNN